MPIDIDECVAEILDIGHCILPDHFPRTALEECRQAFEPYYCKMSLLASPKVTADLTDGRLGCPLRCRSITLLSSTMIR